MAYPPESDALYEQQTCQYRKSGDRRKCMNVFGNFVDRNEFTFRPRFREICHAKTLAESGRPLVGLIGGNFQSLQAVRKCDFDKFVDFPAHATESPAFAQIEHAADGAPAAISPGLL